MHSGNLANVSHSWADVAGSYASPASLGSGERFGYAYHDSSVPSSLSNPGAGEFIALSDAMNYAVMSSSGMSGIGCVSFTAQASATTPAGSYSTTAIYTAVSTY